MAQTSAPLKRRLFYRPLGVKADNDLELRRFQFNYDRFQFNYDRFQFNYDRFQS